MVSMAGKSNQDAEYKKLTEDILAGKSVKREPEYKRKAVSHQGNDFRQYICGSRLDNTAYAVLPRRKNDDGKSGCNRKAKQRKCNSTGNIHSYLHTKGCSIKRKNLAER